MQITSFQSPPPVRPPSPPASPVKAAPQPKAPSPESVPDPEEDSDDDELADGHFEVTVHCSLDGSTSNAVSFDVEPTTTLADIKHAIEREFPDDPAFKPDKYMFGFGTHRLVDDTKTLDDCRIEDGEEIYLVEKGYHIKAIGLSRKWVTIPASPLQSISALKANVENTFSIKAGNQILQFKDNQGGVQTLRVVV